MKMKIFAIRDCKSEQYGTPMYMIKEAEAVRSLGIEVNKPADGTQPLTTHPEDFSLWLLGEYDTETGEMHTHAPRRLVEAAHLRQRPQNQ